jgi:hypothetical protein
MADLLVAFIKPEYPKSEYTESAVVTRIEYIGPREDIVDDLPLPGETWGDYVGQVKSVSYEPTEDIDVVEAMVTVEQPIDNAETTTGTLVAISYEIRWLTIERSMYEHPAFSSGGSYQLSNQDIYDIEKWQAPENTKELRTQYKYNEALYETELSGSAKMFARGIELGLETFEDKAPTAIKISEYVNGPPPETDAGIKEDPVGFPNLPTGFQWRKETADSTRAGGATKWNLTEEWLGAKTVLFDRLNVYWTPPS